jgi:hypothetical protein
MRLRRQRATELLAVVEELERLVAAAPSVPLTNQIRLDDGEVRDVLRRLRAAIDAAALDDGT